MAPAHSTVTGQRPEGGLDVSNPGSSGGRQGSRGEREARKQREKLLPRSCRWKRDVMRSEILDPEVHLEGREVKCKPERGKEM